MDDKLIMENLLSLTKGACDLLMHGSIESSTLNVHSTFRTALDDCLSMQNEIYNKMSEKGWYPMQQAEQQKIEQAKIKFSGQ